MLLGTTSQFDWEEPKRRKTRFSLTTHIRVSKKFCFFMTVNIKVFKSTLIYILLSDSINYFFIRLLFLEKDWNISICFNLDLTIV